MSDDVSIRQSLEGGDAGGVSRPRIGTGPGEQTGMCLFGTAAGVPLEEVFRVRCGGGVDDRAGKGGALATMVAMMTGLIVEYRQLHSKAVMSRSKSAWRIRCATGPGRGGVGQCLLGRYEYGEWSSIVNALIRDVV